MTIEELKAENARLKAEVERLEHQVNYWRIEAETDNARWLRCLEEIDRLRKAAKEGKQS
jgi:cell division septum initiation protein DivIVA